MKLKANIRFHNAFDSKIYDEGEEFTAKEADAEYLIANKIASEVKAKVEKTEPKSKK